MLDSKLSHLDKILFPASNITKGDLVAYYDKIAPSMLAYSKDHMVVMQRFPHGIAQEGFFQKQISE